jgi:OOP family OmpA-OmpF porin
LALFLGLALTTAACVTSSATTTTAATTTTETPTTVAESSTTRPPRDSSLLAFSLSVGKLTLSGSVPDEQGREALVGAARSAFGEENVTDSLQVERSAGSLDTAALEALVGIVTELPTWFDAAELRVRGTDLNVTGDALSAEALEEATSFLEATTGLTITLELEISPVAQTRDEIKALLETEVITFATGSAEITDEGVAVLERVIELLAPTFAARPRVEVRIDGHTDDEGPEDFNRDLSLRRARAVLDYMVAAGLPAANLSAEGFGESRPIADNGTAEGRAKNRRIEFTLEG